MMKAATQLTSVEDTKEQFFEIRIGSVAPNEPLAYDLFLFINRAPVLFRRRGDFLTAERIKLLYRDGGDTFLIPNDQRQLYLDSLFKVIRNPDSSTDLKARFIKESAYLHINDLFTRKDIAPVVVEASILVDEMVGFVSSDLEAVSSLMRLSRHDYYTYNHCVDVAVYSIALAKRICGEEKEMLLRAGLGGLLHDIGKRNIDWNLINKTTALTPVEWEEIKKHPTYGMDCLESIPCVPDASRLVVFEHHENFDGTGYPCRIKGEEISTLARIVTIADVFDALTTDRSYHKAMSPKEALNTMFGMQPGKFDPNLFKSFNKDFDKKPSLKFSQNFDPCHPQSTGQMFVKK